MKNIIRLITIFFIITLFLTGCYGSGAERNTANILPETSVPLAAAEDTGSAIADPEPDSSTIVQENTAGTRQVNAAATLEGVLKLHFLDVGQADCIFIELPNNENMLIDAGNNGDKDAILGYLNAKGVKKLDYVIGTHPHEDHIGSLDAVINNYDIGSIFMPKVSSNTNTFEDVLTAIQSKGLKVRAPESGSYIINLKNQIDKSTIRDELVIQFLAPNGTGYDDVNNYSLVVKITFRNTSFLMMGDAEDISEKEILSAGYDIKANLVKIGHHGSENSTTTGFLADVQPQYAVISVGKGNDYGHPAQSTIDRLKAAGVKILRTDESGTITAASDGNTITISKSGSQSTVQNGSEATKQSSLQTAGQTPVKPVIGDKTAQNNDITVYIAKTGEKYHLDGCRSLSKSKMPVKLSEAKAKGYEPCGICKPPR